MMAQNNEYKLTVADIQRCWFVDGTGTVRWKQSVEPVGNKHLWLFRGSVAGTVTAPKPSGVQYRRVRYTKQGKAYNVYAQVIAFTLHNGVLPEGEVDHIDGNGLNNTGVNLRDASRRVNMCNAKLHKLNVSGVKGVIPDTRCPNMWLARASINGKVHKLYYGDDFFEACCARKSFEVRNDGDRAYSGRGNLRGG